MDQVPAMKKITQFNYHALNAIENLILVTITVATVAAGGEEVMRMIVGRTVHLSDLLLLFLYLEVLAMVGQYYESRKIPVRYPIYIGIMALARYLILDMKELNESKMLTVVAAILILAIASLVLRYGHIKYPYPESARKDFGSK